MKKTGLHWLERSVIIAVAFSAACAADASVGQNRRGAFPSEVASAKLTDSRTDERAVDLGACGDLGAPEGSTLVFHVYAKGVQIYRWNGASWSFVAPSAVLSADAQGKSTVGIHYGGPTWESSSGSKVIGTVLKRCTPDASSIPWLLLGAVSTEGPGIFHRVAFIQRVNTVGGNAPSTPGTVTGEEVRVPYTTEYFFYRAS